MLVTATIMEQVVIVGWLSPTNLSHDVAACDLTGSVVVTRFVGPLVRRFAGLNPSAWASTARVHLVCSFLTLVLAEADAPIDTGDGVGTNLMDIPWGGLAPATLDATAPGTTAHLLPLSPVVRHRGENSSVAFLEGTVLFIKV
jgi:sugar (pentulose or hexulose) kinase